MKLSRDFENGLEAAINHVNRLRTSPHSRKLGYVVGRKYVKLVDLDENGKPASVYGFVDINGNIYKAAGWAAPAKHIRGNIYRPAEFPNVLGQYSVAYLR